MAEIKGRLLLNSALCTGCRSCEVACSLAHEGSFWPEKARVQVYKNEAEGEDFPRVCRQCEEPSCMEACPEEALQRDPKTGAILVGAACTGCGVCAAACDYDAIRIDREREKALLCDLCGGKPACVQRCVVHALTYRNSAGELITAPVQAITLPRQ